MEKNCFHISSIKGVDDNNLPVLNALSFITDGLGDFELGFMAPVGTIISWTGGVQLLAGAVNQSLVYSPFTIVNSVNTTVVKGSPATKITINNKYALTRLNVKSTHVSVALKDIYGCSALEVIMESDSNTSLEGLDISKLLSNKLKLIQGIKKIICDLAALGTKTDMERIEGTMENQSVIYGNISSLVNLKKLTMIDLRYSTVEGNLESFVENQMQGTNGRTSGTLEMKLNASQVTLNGTPVTLTMRLNYSSDTCVLKDTSNNVKATYTKSTGTWTYA